MHAAGSGVARRFIRSFGAHLTRLAHAGGAGANQDFLRPGLRLVVHGPYKIFFERTPDTVLLLRVIHGARDVRAAEFGARQDQP